MRRTGIITDTRCLDHVTDPGHPETPGRLQRILQMLEGCDFEPDWIRIEAQPAAREDILRVHTADYFQRIASTAGGASASQTP